MFLALPDAAAAELAPALVDAGVRVIDLSGAFRLRDAAARARWYPETHRLPDGVAYGLTERERGAVARARLVANPGCYPTATLLALAPLVAAGPARRPAPTSSSTRSRASRAPARRRPSARISRSATAACRRYGVFNHRHGAEIEQGSAGRSRSRRIWCRSIAASSRRSTCAWRPARPKRRSATSTSAPTPARRSSASSGPALPEIKHVAHTNFCDIGWRVDPSGRAILVSVIDNLLKGASGQAVQNMNVMLGLDETTGLL